MVKAEYGKYIRSKFNLLLMGCFAVCAGVSYYATYCEKMEWVRQLQNPAPDLNVAYTKILVSGYNGFTYLYDFFRSDMYTVFVLLLLAGLGVFFGGTTWKNVHSGYGNLLVARMRYRKYIHNILAAQILYIVSFLSALVLSLTVLSLILFPVHAGEPTTGALSLPSDTLPGNLLICLCFAALLLLYVVFVMVLSSLSCFLVRNKYLIQTVPLLIYLVPFLLASTIGNFTALLGKILPQFVGTVFVFLPYNYLMTEMSVGELIFALLPLPLLFIGFIVAAYVKNIRTYEGAYL